MFQISFYIIKTHYAIINTLSFHKLMAEPNVKQPALKCGVMQLQDVIEECMQKHWDEFRKDSQRHFDSFRKEYIEPSVQFIENEKREADSKYVCLQNDYNTMKRKCSDLERYNTLLQEKLETMEKEMVSFSQVSMIAKWEKRLHTKNQECERIQESLDKTKAHVIRLQRENTLLNTQLERREEQLVQSSFEGKIGVIGEFTMDKRAVLTNHSGDTKTSGDACFLSTHLSHSAILSEDQTSKPHDDGISALPDDVVTKTSVVHGKSTADKSYIAPSQEADNVEEKDKSLVDAKQKPNEPLYIIHDRQESMESNNGVDDNTSNHLVTEIVNDSEPASDSTLEKKADIPKESIVHEKGIETAKTFNQFTVGGKEVDHSEMDCASEERVIYTVKRLKRTKDDKEKTKYMFGSDKKLYEWQDGDQPGNEVGYQMEKNGRKVFKFISK